MDKQFVTDVLTDYLTPLLRSQALKSPRATPQASSAKQPLAPQAILVDKAFLDKEPFVPATTASSAAHTANKTSLNSAALRDAMTPQRLPDEPAVNSPDEATGLISAEDNSCHKQRLEKMLAQVAAAPTVDNVSLDTENCPQHQQQYQQQSCTEQPSTEKPRIEKPGAIPALTSEWLENGRPQWAQQAFDILLIDVNGLKLALPLIALGQIHERVELTPLFGQSAWFMGLLKTAMGNIKVVDTGKFVMAAPDRPASDYRFVVSINGLPWGLAVDTIGQPIAIDPDEIRWRPSRTKRPWMAGTVKNHMCVLIDVPSLGERLQSHDKNQA